MEITCFRDRERSRETRSLPAPVYNLARTLMGRSPSGIVFVPIRSMQYLAILDGEEFVFVDHLHKSWIAVAWQHFRPQARSALDEPVPYEAVFYDADGASTMRRLMSEFPKALKALAEKDRVDGPAKVLKFEKRRED
jgi:hypothetical protein